MRNPNFTRAEKMNGRVTTGAIHFQTFPPYVYTLARPGSDPRSKNPTMASCKVILSYLALGAVANQLCGATAEVNRTRSRFADKKPLSLGERSLDADGVSETKDLEVPAGVCM